MKYGAVAEYKYGKRDDEGEYRLLKMNDLYKGKLENRFKHENGHLH